MAEITDRLPAAPTGPGFDPDLPPARDDFAAYRPLSFLALGGFGLAVVCVLLICLGGWMAIFFRYPYFSWIFTVLTPVAAAVVCLMLGKTNPGMVFTAAALALAGELALLGLGGLLLFSSADPWLLPFWTFALPVGALIVLWIGRSLIVRSENTIGGLALCHWGLGLVLVFGLLYAAYYGATVLAVRNQSAAYADEWLSVVQKGDLETAFARTVPPDQRPAEDANLRMQLETLFNLPGPRDQPGAFTDFGLKEYMRLLEGTSDTATVERLGLLKLDYDNHQFMVVIGYRLTTPACTIELHVAVRSRDVNTDQFKGRKWYIDPRATGWSFDTPPVFTDLGTRVVKQSGATREFIDNWFTKWYHGDDDAYLLTLPAAQRRAVLSQRPVLGTALGGTALLAEPGRQSFYEGGLIDADAKRFFPIRAEHRNSIPAALKKAFRPGAEKPEKAELLNQLAVMPLLHPVEGGTQLVYEVHFAIDESKKDLGMVNVDGRMILECDPAALAENPPQWQVKSIQLVRAYSTAPESAADGQGPQGSGMRMRKGLSTKSPP